MYLAPLNHDRYFKKVFSDERIAKQFLEDFLDVSITFLERLPSRIGWTRIRPSSAKHSKLRAIRPLILINGMSAPTARCRNAASTRSSPVQTSKHIYK